MVSDDGVLAARAQGGDRAAFGALIDRHWRTVAILAYQKLGRATEADDLCQETFLKAYRSLGTLKDPARFAAWVYHIALRLIIDHVRARSRRRHASLDDLQDRRSVEFEAGAAEDPVERSERADQVMRALGRLPPSYRLVLVLRYYEGLSYREIADRLGAPPGTIANRIWRATRLLKEKLDIRFPVRAPDSTGGNGSNAGPAARRPVLSSSEEGVP